MSYSFNIASKIIKISGKNLMKIEKFLTNIISTTFKLYLKCFFTVIWVNIWYKTKWAESKHELKFSC